MAEKQKVRKAVVTDGGYATRFFPITKTVPKCMLPIADKPITQHVIEECMAAGITEVIVVATEEGRAFYDDYFHNTVQHIYEQLQKQGKESRFQGIRDVFNLPNVVVITQDKKLPYGTLAPMISALPYIGDEPFLYIHADDIVLGKSACLDLVEAYEAAGDDIGGIIAAQDMPDADVTRYGVIKIKDGTENIMEKIVEKPEPEDAPSTLLSFGRFLYTPKIFDYISADKDYLGKDNELWNVDAATRMGEDHPVIVKPISGRWYTTGDPLNYLKATVQFALEQDELRDDFKSYLKEIL